MCCLLQYETLGMTSHYKVCIHLAWTICCQHIFKVDRTTPSKSLQWSNMRLSPQVYEASFIEEVKAEPEAG